MATLTPTRVTTLASRADTDYGTANRPFQLIVVDATTTATDDTTDLSTYVSSTSAIVAEISLAIDGAEGVTADTWSGTTVTWASYAGSGVTNAVFLVY